MNDSLHILLKYFLFSAMRFEVLTIVNIFSGETPINVICTDLREKPAALP
jgi:hypothetical protein